FTNASSVITLDLAGQNGRNTLRMTDATNSFLRCRSLAPLFRGTQPSSIFLVVQQNNTDALAMSWNTEDVSNDYGYAAFRYSGTSPNSQAAMWEYTSGWATDLVAVGTACALGEFSFDGSSVHVSTNGDAGANHATSARPTSTDQ